MALAFIGLFGLAGYAFGAHYQGDSGVMWPQLLAVAGVILAVIIIMVTRTRPE